MRHFAPLLLFPWLGACADFDTPAPSLAPRPIESVDPRLPLESAAAPQPADAALAARLSELIAQARTGDAAFQNSADSAQRLADGAGPARSESWVSAQEALSAAIADRGPTTRALGDIDSLAADSIAARGGLAPGDLTAIESAASLVGAIAQEQERRIAAIRSLLQD